PSFALQIARLYMGDQGSPRSESASHGSMGRKLDPSAEVMINYLGPPRTVKTVSYYQALDYERTLPPGVFQGKIVLVGRATQAAPEPDRSAPDVFQTPFLLSAGALTPGVEIHATIISNILTGRFVTEPPLWARLVLF